MNKKLLYIIFCMMVSHIVCAQDLNVDNSFKEAVQALNNNEIEKSLNLLMAIPEGLRSTQWYKISALCFEKANKKADALYTLRTAQEYASVFLLPKINKDLTKLLAINDNQQDGFLYLLFLYMQRIIPLIIVQLIFLLLMIVYLLYFLKKINISFKKMILLCSIHLVCGGIISLYTVYSSKRYAIVTQDEVSVYVGPQNSYAVVGSFKQGKQIEILQEFSGWYKVSSENTRGWVELSSCKIFKKLM